MEPLVSVIMPVYNAQKYIGEALESVLNQTYKNFELIIIDDCGKDDSIKIVENYNDPRIRIFHNSKNCGIAYSRNRGLESSRGEYIAILDDDDIALSGRFEQQVSFLQSNKTFDVVGGESVWIDGNGQIIRDRFPMPQDSDYIKTSFLFENMYNNSEVMIRRTLLDEHHIRYGEDMFGMEDFKFWIDCSKVGRFTNINDCFLKRRMGINNTTSQMLNTKKEERISVYQGLQEYSIKKSGFNLKQEEYSVLHQFIGEDRVFEMAPRDSLSFFYCVLEKMLRQAQELEFSSLDSVKQYMTERLKNCI